MCPLVLTAFTMQIMWNCLKELIPGRSDASHTGVQIDGKVITDKLQTANVLNMYVTSIGQGLGNRTIFSNSILSTLSL